MCIEAQPKLLLFIKIGFTLSLKLGFGSFEKNIVVCKWGHYEIVG
jgi:hypothetical protein